MPTTDEAGLFREALELLFRVPFSVPSSETILYSTPLSEPCFSGYREKDPFRHGQGGMRPLLLTRDFVLNLIPKVVNQSLHTEYGVPSRV